jgi:hypothetical protein
MARMSDPSSYANDLEAVGALARLIGQRLAPLYQLAPDVLPTIAPVDMARKVHEHLRSGDADAARMLVAFLWPTDAPPEGWWDTAIGRRCSQLGVDDTRSTLG